MHARLTCLSRRISGNCALRWQCVTYSCTVLSALCCMPLLPDTYSFRPESVVGFIYAADMASCLLLRLNLLLENDPRQLLLSGGVDMTPKIGFSRKHLVASLLLLRSRRKLPAADQVWAAVALRFGGTTVEIAFFVDEWILQ